MKWEKFSLKAGMRISLFALAFIALRMNLLLFSHLHAIKEIPVDGMKLDSASAVSYNLEKCETDAHDVKIIRQKIHSKLEYNGNGSRYLQLTGWAYQSGQSIKTADSWFLLRESGTERYLRLKTVCQTRSDVTEKYGADQYNYDLSGLKAVVSKKALGIGKTYDVFIAYNNNGANLLVDLHRQITVR